MSSGAMAAANAPAPASPFKSKTFWFSFLGAVAHVAFDYKNPQTWAEGVAIVGAAYGAREAISKNGNGV